ncbi:hypothetical protein SAMN05192588_1557 [Nonlabens sp. Hel1_33_55]|nr:hypothetical protein SAMN05192588_1557 [Nonlabens sp. Hel1_33_55]
MWFDRVKKNKRFFLGRYKLKSEAYLATTNYIAQYNYYTKLFC